jgi:CshA-type fibril repeat protein
LRNCFLNKGFGLSYFRKALTACLVVGSFGAIGQDQVRAVDASLNLNFEALSFLPEADLVSSSSNLGPGFTRRYESVATIGGVVVDAVVTIVSQSGNTGNELDTFDQYDNTQHLSAHTKPSGSAESSGKIKVEFVADGTNTPVVLNNVRASIADIDAHEFGTFYGIANYRLSTGTQLSRSGTTAGVYRFHSSTTGASNTDEKRILEVAYGSTSSVVTAFGCRSGASSAIGAGGKCGFTVVIGTVARTLGFVDTVVDQPSYTVTYSANTCTTGTVPAPTSGAGSLTIADNTGTLSQGSNVFLGWNTLANGTGTMYQPGSSILPTENITLYAMCGTAPSADPETSSGASDANQTIDVLTGDVASTGATLIPSSVRLCATGTDNSVCTATSLTIAGEGTYTVNTTTGVVTFNPESTFSGTAAPIKYVVADSNGLKASSTITPTVAAGEVPTVGKPAADNETSTGASDVNQVIDVLVGDTASEGATLDPTSVRLCITGTADASCTGTSLTVTGEGVYTVDPATGVVTFNPESTFSGTATPIKYIVKDSTNKTASATITPTVQPPPPASSPPSATPETKSVIPGGSVSFTTVTGAGGLGSGTDLVASATCLLVPGTSTCDADGVVAIAGEGTYTLVASTGIVTYVADANAVQGSKTSISYRITDKDGFKATSTLTPTIPPPPTADNETSSGSINTAQVIDVVTGDAAGSGATLDRTTVRLCATGTATASCTGTTLTVTGEGTYTVNTTTGVVTFVPVSTFTGTATPIKYVIADSTGQKAAATITPTVVAPATGPSAEPESKTVLPGNTVSFTTVTGAGGLGSGTGLVTSGANATCLFNTGTTTCAGTTTDSYGNRYSTVTVTGEGTYTLNLASGVVSFAAAANVTPGQKTPITYRITDASGLKATSTLTPIVPPPPTASPDSSQGVKNTEQTLMPLNNDTPGSSIHSPFVVASIKLCDQGTSPETTPNCTKTSVTVANQGTYVVNANGTVTFTPVTDYVSVNYQSSTGPVVSIPITPVHYTVLDALGQKAASTLTPKVVPPPAPITAVDTGTAEQGSVVELSPWTNDSPGVNPGGEGKPDPQLVPTSIRLCDKTEAAPTCTKEDLTTVDGRYVVDTSTGKVTFTHVEGFEGTVAEPVTYIIANNWTGLSGTGISTNVLIPTIIVTAQAAPAAPEPAPADPSPAPEAEVVSEVPSTTTTTTTIPEVPVAVSEVAVVVPDELPSTGADANLELLLMLLLLGFGVLIAHVGKTKSSPR